MWFAEFKSSHGGGHDLRSASWPSHKGWPGMGKAGKFGHLKCHDCAMIAMDMPWICHGYPYGFCSICCK